jgi:hypothetical protein
LTALQPYFDKLLLIPGMEMATFQGHANAFNLREPVDFRVGGTEVPDWNTLLRQAKNTGAVVSINHPRVPTSEARMGCGWSPNPAADLSLVQAVEVVNGHDTESHVSGIPFWHPGGEAQLVVRGNVRWPAPLHSYRRARRRRQAGLPGNPIYVN